MGPKRFGSSASVSGACCKDGATCVRCCVLGLASLRTRRVWKPGFDKTCKHEWKQNSLQQAPETLAPDPNLLEPIMAPTLVA